MKKILLSAVIALSVAAPAYAASGNSSTTTGSATAVVVAPIVLTHTAAATLGFGSFTTGTSGTVVVSSAGAGSVTGDVGFVPGSTNSADAFTVAGDNGRNFSIATTGGSLAPLVGSGPSMPFTTAPSASSGTLSGSGAASFTVGGTLTVAAGLAAGQYNGSYSATVAYD